MASTSKPLVLLTGATGYVGAHILSQLLSANYAILAPVRSASKSTFLQNKYPNDVASGDLTFVTVEDLQRQHALDQSLQERKVEHIVHVASPFFLSTTDPIKDLVEPALEGTRNVLTSALAHGNALKKVIVLSSFAAVQDPFAGPRPGYTYSEADWCPVTLAQAATNGVLGYLASKTHAEKCAWDIYNAASPKPDWDLLTLCPPMVYGPALHQVDPSKGIQALNTSLSFLVAGITAPAGKVATPHLPHWIDVRDLALAHLKALATPAGTEERILLCSGAAAYEDGLAGLRAKGVKGLAEPGEKIDAKAWFEIGTDKAKSVLGMQFRGFESCVEDVWAWAEDVGLIGEDLESKI